MAAKLSLEVITAERVAYTAQDVDIVSAPGYEGQLAILPRHAALMTVLRPGELRIKKGNEETVLALTGGFMEVHANKIIVLAPAAEHATEIDVQRAEAARKRAQDLIKQHPKDVDLQQALTAYYRAEARLKVAKRHRRPGRG